MHIDISKLKSGMLEYLDIDESIDSKLFNINDSRIKDLIDIHFTGNLSLNIEGNYILEGKVTGTMILVDDITLNEINYRYSSEIDEKLEENDKNNQNMLDITEILWQNIVVEVPMRITEGDINSLNGEGWKVISEETYNNASNTALGDLLKEAGKE